MLAYIFVDSNLKSPGFRGCGDLISRVIEIIYGRSHCCRKDLVYQTLIRCWPLELSRVLVGWDIATILSNYGGHIIDCCDKLNVCYRAVVWGRSYAKSIHHNAPFNTIHVYELLLRRWWRCKCDRASDRAAWVLDYQVKVHGSRCSRLSDCNKFHRISSCNISDTRTRCHNNFLFRWII